MLSFGNETAKIEAMNRPLMIIAAVILAAVPGLLVTDAQDRPKGEAHPIKLWAAIFSSAPDLSGGTDGETANLLRRRQ
jgi:hypothetical protein